MRRIRVIFTFYYRNYWIITTHNQKKKTKQKQKQTERKEEEEEEHCSLPKRQTNVIVCITPGKPPYKVINLAHFVVWHGLQVEAIDLIDVVKTWAKLMNLHQWTFLNGTKWYLNVYCTKNNIPIYLYYNA